MVLTTIKNRFQNLIAEHRDFRTSRHVVVFESDDWGSIRMSNENAWNELLHLGYAVNKRPYERFDTLESAEDLEALFEVLSKYQDCKGNHPVITANMLMANPDFERIRESGFQEYYYEPISKTYERYFGNTRVLDLMRQGYESGVFMPQCHGREHFNVAEWMQGLQAGDEDLLTAFRFGMCGVAPKAHPELGNQMMKALYAETEEGQQQIDELVSEGLQMFEKMWGFKSKSFVAPCYVWNEDIEIVLAENVVKIIQTSRVKKETYQSTKQILYSGQLSKFNQVYSIRNCAFEPSTNEGGSTVSDIMRQVEKAFSNNKIAIFSTHRINYVNGLFDGNREKTLYILDGFLRELLAKYPDTEFVSSDKLGLIY